MELDEHYSGIWESKVEVKKHRHKSGANTKLLECVAPTNNVSLKVKVVCFLAANSTRSIQTQKGKK